MDIQLIQEKKLYRATLIQLPGVEELLDEVIGNIPEEDDDENTNSNTEDDDQTKPTYSNPEDNDQTKLTDLNIEMPACTKKVSFCAKENCNFQH